MTDSPSIAPTAQTPVGALRPIDPLLVVPMHFLPPVLTPVKEPFLALLGTARTIADDTTGEPAQRMALLDGMAALVLGQKPTIPMDLTIVRVVEDFVETVIDHAGDPLHVTHLLQACRQDVTKRRYRDWNDLLVYCRFAAAPIGRFTLEVIGEPAAQAQVEALCCALAVLILLRDCASDYRRFDRVFLPERWFREAGSDVSVLGGERCDEGLRRVLAQGLDAVERLMVTARPLPRLIGDRHARAAAASALVMAEKMARRLRRGDPLAAPILPTLCDGQVALWAGRWRKFRR